MDKYWGSLNFQDGVLDELGSFQVLNSISKLEAGLDGGWRGPESGKVILY